VARWVEVELGPGDVDAGLVDELSGRLWSLGVVGIEERPLDGGGVRLVVGPAHDDPAAVLAELTTLREGDRWGGLRVRALASDEEPWLDEWRAHAEVVRVGRFVVQPAWLAAAPTRPGDVVVVLDPGRAFGHGAHPTTRQALAALERLVSAGTSALDVGCGSGVLSLAAAALGARVVAVDVAGDAVAATRANAERNGVAAFVEVSDTPVGAVRGRFDVVVANIGAATLVELAGALTARTAPGGVVVLAGVLAQRRDEVLAAYDRALGTSDGVVDATAVAAADGASHDGRWRVLAEDVLDGWWCVSLRAPADREHVDAGPG
jgi:ribosomal protein L11 methyltransferase